MTYSVSDVTEENSGSYWVEWITLNITSLSNAGHEAVTLTNETKHIDRVNGVSVEGQENGGYHITYDHLNDRVSVKYADYDAAADGVLINVPSTTDVGEVVLKVEGT